MKTAEVWIELAEQSSWRVILKLKLLIQKRFKISTSGIKRDCDGKGERRDETVAANAVRFLIIIMCSKVH